MTAPDLWPTKAMVAEAAEDGKGFWNTCSGCHYSNEGYPTGPYHPVLQCHVGGGCFECGGIGAIWDTTNYAAMGDCLAQENTRAPLAEAHPLADEARAALANDDVAGWIGSLPKATLAEALAVPDSFDTLISEARAEAAKAMRKFPQPNYVISKVAEEAGEVVKAAIHAAEGRETLENLRGEMKQTIAMLYRLWVEGDQVHGLPPVDPDRAIGERRNG